MKHRATKEQIEERVGKWNSKKTLLQNAAALKMNYNAAYAFAWSHALKFSKKTAGRPRLVRYHRISTDGLTDQDRRIKELLPIFRAGGKQASQAARELAKLGVRVAVAKPTPPLPDFVKQFPGDTLRALAEANGAPLSVKTWNFVQMPAGTRFTNPNYEAAKERMGMGCPL